MTKFVFPWDTDGQFAADVVCVMEYEPPEPSAYPGSQGSSCDLLSMSLCGVALPLHCITPKQRQRLEIEACDWFENDRQACADEARVEAFA